MINATLDDFKWTPRRLSCDRRNSRIGDELSKIGMIDSIKVQGKYQSVIFHYRGNYVFVDSEQLYGWILQADIDSDSKYRDIHIMIWDR